MSGAVRTTRSMAYDAFDGVILEVHPDCPPDEREWDGFVAWLCARDLSRVRGLTFAEGPGPNAGQRKKLMTVPGVDVGLSVVLTTSLVARGAITALNWLGYKNLKGFDYKNLVAAMDYLDIPPERHHPIAQRVLELKCELLGVTLAELPYDRAALDLATLTFDELAQVLMPRSARPSARRR